ncbi:MULTISPECIES: hypothetical protein [unclassified Rhodococcus (in: high G+C Gram-positive bacteria)]|uniref:hypothetical protein n=1 Tax=Rhodococcus sp. SJ-3 TaxID=3454628 RepID=UPI003F792771
MTNAPQHNRPTTGSRAAGWVGYGCVLVGIALIALVLAAAGDGFEGWATLGIIAGIVVFLVGGVMIAFNFRRRTSD